MFSSKVIVKTGFLGLMFVPTREVIIMVDVGGFTVIAWSMEAGRRILHCWTFGSSLWNASTSTSSFYSSSAHAM